MASSSARRVSAAPASGGSATGARAVKAEATDPSKRTSRRYPTGIIRLLPAVKTPEGTLKNPKKPGSRAHERFKLYKDGMTVAAYLQAGGIALDLSWDSEHKFIRIEAEPKSTQPAPQVDKSAAGN